MDSFRFYSGQKIVLNPHLRSFKVNTLESCSHQLRLQMKRPKLFVPQVELHQGEEQFIYLKAASLDDSPPDVDYSRRRFHAFHADRIHGWSDYLIPTGGGAARVRLEESELLMIRTCEPADAAARDTTFKEITPTD